MKNGQRIDLGLTGYDELFMTDQERQENRLPKIYDIPLSEIDDFPDHPFKVRLDEDMDQLVQSVKDRGIIVPITLRPKEDGRYEIVSGHRRKKACELAGLETIRAEIKDLTRDEAIILMVESNLQRSVILPSEKAFSYKMRLEAMKRMPGRPSKENGSPVGNNFQYSKSSDEMADSIGESKNQIYRYIRLTELIPTLLDVVDEGRIGMRPAVELSYLSKEQQEQLADVMSYMDCTPSHDQAIRMRKMSAEGKLTLEAIEAIMGEVKPNQREKISFRADRLRQYIPKNISPSQTEDYVMKTLPSRPGATQVGPRLPPRNPRPEVLKWSGLLLLKSPLCERNWRRCAENSKPAARKPNPKEPITRSTKLPGKSERRKTDESEL